MRKKINNSDLKIAPNQTTKLDHLNEQMDEIVDKMDKHYNKNIQSKGRKKDTFKKKRKWFIPTVWSFSVVLAICSTAVVYYFLIDKHIIHKDIYNNEDNYDNEDSYEDEDDYYEDE